jgi:hypothetical protein
LRQVRAEAPAHLLVAACCIVLFRGGLLGDVVFYERDTFLFYEPLGRWFAEHLRVGSIPLWMPLIFGGYPLFADGEIGMLYPPNLVLLPLLPSRGWLTAIRALHFFLAGAFMIGFLRVLSVSRWGALVGGLVFAFGSFLITQVQHENVIRSAIWLPLILMFVERSFQRSGWARQRHLAGAGLALTMAALGVHVQPVAMTLLVLGLYVGYRVAVGPIVGDRWERPLQLLWTPLVVAGVGLAGAAVQWLPLFELGRMSYRGPGLVYDLATTWPLRWQNLGTVLFPYLFRMEDGRYVMLWQQWESFLYVGILPLALIFVALPFGRRRLVPLFVLIGLFGLAIGLADQSPINVHRLLWSLPGFSSLRAPGRFAYLVVFAASGLAALGMDWLATRRSRSWPGVWVGGLFLVGAAGTVWLVWALRSRLIADPVRWTALIDQYYMSVRHEHGWLQAPMVREQLIAGLDLSNPKTALSVGLLFLVAFLVMAWSLWPRRAVLWPALAVAVVAVDLLIFGFDFHPRRSLAELVRPGEITSYLAARTDNDPVFGESEIPALEPNRLLYADVPSVSGYSSLQSQRHYEYWSSVDRQQDVLLDLWGVRYVVLTDPPTDLTIADGTAYRLYNALFNGAANNRTGFSSYAVEPFATTEMRVLATLVDGVEVEQGAPVAELTLTDAAGHQRTVVLRAGEHVAENAYERPDVEANVRHARAPVVGTVPDIGPTGAPTRTNLYGSSFPLPPLETTRVDIRQIHPRAQTRIFGIGLVDASGAVRSLFGKDRAKLRPLHHAEGALVLENTGAFPRAYVVPEAVARRSRSEESALPRLAKRPFDASRQVILEDGPFGGLPLVDQSTVRDPAPGALPVAAAVEDVSTDHVRIRTADGPGGLLVLTDAYHRGWRAWVDGEEAPIYIANFLFRAVRVPDGPHTVEMVFDPLSIRIGRGFAMASLAFSLAILVALPRITCALLARRHRTPGEYIRSLTFGVRIGRACSPRTGTRPRAR